MFTSVGGKVALLKLAYDYTTAGDDDPIPMIDREGLQAINAQPDPYEAMRMYAEFVVDLGERTSALWLALRGAAEVGRGGEGALRALGSAATARHAARPVPRLIQLGALRPDVTPDEAAAIFWVLVDPALYHQLVVVAGWKKDRFRDRVHESFLTQILRPRP